MTLDFDRRLHGSHPYSSGIGKMATAGTYAGRLPLQSRHHYSSQPSGMSSSGEGCTSNNPTTVNRLSTLESSNNENNKARIQSFSTSNYQRYTHRGRSQEKDSSTFAQTGAPAPSTLTGHHHPKPTRSESVGRSDRGRTKASQRGPTQRSTSTSAARSKNDGNNSDNENVIIEEKRKRVNGDGYTLHRYLRGRLLGRGGFAKVYLCTALDTSKNYAVKIVPKANLVKARARQKLQAEIKIHRTLKHAHICEYKHFFEDRNNCYILLELCHNQSLNEMIKRRKRLTEPEAALFMRQLLDAVLHLHDNCVIHRDLKLGNLFLDRNLGIKVGDFGLATKLENADEKRKTICGTPNYIAPEVIQGDKATRGHSFEVDIWSMGVILFTVLVGKPPYEAKDVKATYQRIIANEYSFPSHVAVSDKAKDLIVSMLQSKPEDRPSLQDISGHEFLAAHSLPVSIPINATHSAPEWSMNAFGEIVANGHTHTPEDKYSVGKLSKKPSIPRGGSNRRVLGNRDPNVDSVGNGRAKKEKSDRDVINVQGIVRGGLGGGGQASAGSCNNRVQPSSTPSTSPFQIYDETTESRTPRVQSISKGSFSSRPSPTSGDELVVKTNALSVNTASGGCRKSVEASRPDFPLAQSVVSAVSSAAGGTTVTINTENDANILTQMLDNLENVMAVTDSRKGMYLATSPHPVHRGGPNKWVTRYVDYTSKYGLGFLLNDGSSGVYFNDSTKTVLEADGETFQYIERRKSDDTDLLRNKESQAETYVLSNYPENLQKKVTLLKHFHNYLVEQQKKTEGDGSADFEGNPNSFVYIKKWVRTKHAILFRLSNQTVQIVFYDQTEILLTPDSRYITYVDKVRNRKTFHFNDELVGNNPEFAKRLKYTREIMSQLMTGRR